MRRMGAEAIYPKRSVSRLDVGAKKYPSLLRGVVIERPYQVWAADITYTRMKHGFIYLVAIMDWSSRYVRAWALSITMEVDFCVEALRHALRTRKPEIFNTDQGSQFTSRSFTELLEAEGVMISMDGRGRV
jgi:putative transposase